RRAITPEATRIEDALRASEERLQAIFQHAQSRLMVIAGPIGAVPVMVNRALCDMLGYSEAELLGRPGIDVVHPEDHDIDRERGEAVRRGSTTRPEPRRLVRKDGEVLHAEVSGAPFALYVSRPAVVLEFRDVSPLVVADAALRASEQRYRALVESSARVV